jgi:dienelactone hydrolase
MRPLLTNSPVCGPQFGRLEDRLILARQRLSYFRLDEGGATVAHAGMIAEIISINGDRNAPTSAYVARPLGPGPCPGVVLLGHAQGRHHASGWHHAPGWGQSYHGTTRKFAHHGYASTSHNLCHRAGEGKSDDIAANMRGEGGLPDEPGGALARAIEAAEIEASARLRTVQSLIAKADPRGWHTAACL